MFGRGNATSGEPICSGMMTLPKPTNSGVANSSSMIVPCIVNSWLNCSRLTICSPGRGSSARMMSARMPPMPKNTNDVIRYMYPITLWSVDDIQEAMIRPLDVRGRGPGTPGAGGRLGGAPPAWDARWAWSLSAPARLMAGDELVELRLRDDFHLEEHPAVVDAAELRAASLEGARLRRGQLEVLA